MFSFEWGLFLFVFLYVLKDKDAIFSNLCFSNEGVNPNERQPATKSAIRWWGESQTNNETKITATKTRGTRTPGSAIQNKHGAKECKSYRSRTMRAPSLTIRRVDTAENDNSEVSQKWGSKVAAKWGIGLLRRSSRVYFAMRA